MPSCARRPSPSPRPDGPRRRSEIAGAPVEATADSELIARAVALGEHGRRPRRRTPGSAASSSRRTARSSARAATSRPGGPHAEVARPRRRRRRAPAAPPPTSRSSRARTTAARRPCADALVAAGVAPGRRRARGSRHAGRRPRAANGSAPPGIDVDVGVGRRRGARRRWRPTCTTARTGRALVPGQDRDELDGADRRGRRVLAVDHRVRRARRRPSAAGRLAGRRRRRRHRARRPARRSPSATSTRPSDRQPLRVLLDARGRVPATGPLFDAALAPDAGRHHRARVVRRASTRGGRRARRSRPSRRSHGEASTSRRRSTLLGRHGVLQAHGRGRPDACTARCSPPGSSTGSSRTSRRRCSAPRALPAFPGPDVATLADAPRLAARTGVDRSATTSASSTSPRSG